MRSLRQLRRFDWTKRGFDVIASTLGMAVSMPVQLVVATTIAANLGRPVLFKQERPGKDGRVFVLHKFRTMKGIDLARGLVSDADRLTRFGRVLRATSLDELPTLWNVLRGDMSIVGPRPLLVRYLDRYSAEEARRHEVRPGVTGLAQANGRNALTWKEKFELDVYYVDHRSFRLDGAILIRTLRAVLNREGVAAEGDATMPEFAEGRKHATP